jgi:hypothetical protein
MVGLRTRSIPADPPPWPACLTTRPRPGSMSAAPGAWGAAGAPVPWPSPAPLHAPASPAASRAATPGGGRRAGHRCSAWSWPWRPDGGGRRLGVRAGPGPPSRPGVRRRVLRHPPRRRQSGSASRGHAPACCTTPRPWSTTWSPAAGALTLLPGPLLRRGPLQGRGLPPGRDRRRPGLGARLRPAGPARAVLRGLAPGEARWAPDGGHSPLRLPSPPPATCAAEWCWPRAATVSSPADDGRASKQAQGRRSPVAISNRNEHGSAGIEADPNSSLAHRDGDHLPAGGDQDQAIGGGEGGEVGGQADGNLTARSPGGRCVAIRSATSPSTQGTYTKGGRDAVAPKAAWQTGLLNRWPPTPPRWSAASRYPTPALPTWNTVSLPNRVGLTDPRSASARPSSAQSAGANASS